MIPAHAQRWLEHMRRERLAWEAAHPWQARWQRISWPLRYAYREISFRLDVLIHGHECDG